MGLYAGQPVGEGAPAGLPELRHTHRPVQLVPISPIKHSGGLDVTRFVLLDNIAHKDLRVRTGYSAEFGDNVNNVLVFPTEFAFAQREYPILFRRDSVGQSPGDRAAGARQGRKPVPGRQRLECPLRAGGSAARAVPDRLPQSGSGRRCRPRAGDPRRSRPPARSARPRANRCSCATAAIRPISSAPTGCCRSSTRAPPPPGPCTPPSRRRD